MRFATILVVVVVVAACGSSSKPGTGSGSGSSSALALTGPLGADDLEREVRRVAATAGAKLAIAPLPDGDLPAAGPCARPDDAQRDAIAKVVVAWIGKVTPGEKPADEPPSLAFGCLEPAGIVVDVQADASSAGASHPNVGHWWTLRVAGDKVEVVTQLNGTAVASWSEYVIETEEHTVALADLDGDGKLDVVHEHVEREGNTITQQVALSVLTSGHKVTSLGSMGDQVTAAETATPEAGLPLVLRIERADVTAFRCLDGKLALVPCAAGTAAKAHDTALAIVEILTKTQARYDREQLDRDLAAIGVSAADRAPLVASAPPTDAAMRAARHIAKLVEARDGDRSYGEREALRAAEMHAHVDQLRAALGDAACPPPATEADKAAAARIERWARSNDKLDEIQGGSELCETGPCKLGPPAQVTIVDRCVGAAGGFYVATWQRALPADALPARGTLHKALLWLGKDAAAKDADVEILEANADGLFGPPTPAGPPAAPQLTVVLYRHGDAAVAMGVNAVARLTGAVDGKPIGTQDDVSGWYEGGIGIAITPDGEKEAYWHAGPTALVKVADLSSNVLGAPPAGSDAVSGLIAKRVAWIAAWQALGGIDEGTQLKTDDQRAQAIQALGIVGADKLLIDEVKSLK